MNEWYYARDDQQRGPLSKLEFRPLSHLLYSIYFPGRFGATPGEIVCGLQVVRSSGDSITYGRATGRAFSEILSGLPLGIRYLIAAFDNQKRTLHDHIFDTRVIQTRGEF